MSSFDPELIPSRLLAPALAALALGALAAPAAAQTVVIEAPTTHPIAVDGNTHTFDVDVTLELPAGYYTGIDIVLQLPSNPSLVRLGTGSPTSGEFDNATYNSTTNTYTWSQLVPLDLTSGAGVRKFRFNGHLDRYRTRPGTPFLFTAIANGDAGDPAAPFAEASTSHTVSATGTGAELAWHFSTTSTVPYGARNRGYTMSTEATPRPGLIRRYFFALGNPHQSPIDSGATWTIDLGDNLYFLAAGGSTRPDTFPDEPAITFGALPAPYTKTTGLITATLGEVAARENLGTAWIDTFIPCADMAKDPEAAAAIASTYTARADATATGNAWDGTVKNLSVTGTAIGGPDLTVVCGEGGSLDKTEMNIQQSGTRFSWRVTLNPGAGVTEITNAMIADALPPETISIGHVAPDGTNTINTESFTKYYCNFAGVFAGQFDTAGFLAERADHCRTSAFVAGDTHMVFFSPSYAAEDGESLGPVRAQFFTTVSMDWSLANIGAHLENRSWFNGTTIYGARGDAVEEVTNEDPWEDVDQSDPVPDLTSQLTVSNWAITSPIDANGANGTATFNIDHAGRWPVNPHIEIDIPNGVTITEITFPITGCESELPAGVIPTAPFTSSPIVIDIGTATDPWRWAPDSCNVRMGVRFTVDPSWPFIDRQNIPFRVRTRADGTATDATTQNATVLVTTGMDVHLTAACWDAAIPPLVPAPPLAGLALYNAVAVNRGSEDLHEIELRYLVPPHATFVTALPGPDFPSGATLQVSRNGGTSWSPVPGGPDATVTDVRVAGFSIDGLGIDALRPSFYVAVAPSGTGPVVGGAWMETPTSQLGRTPTRETEFAACTGTVIVEKYFDVNANGRRDGGEATLGAGFQFGIDIGGGAVLTGTTDSTGRATIMGVPAGTWSVVETGTPAGDGTWQATTQASVVVTEGGTSVVPFGNSCSCPSNGACQIGECDTLGQCTYRNVADGTRCGEGDVCDGELICQAGQCVATPPKDCDDDDMCTIDACESGACDHEPKPCDEGLTYYVPVANEHGAIIGAFACTVKGGEVTCDMKGGILQVSKELGTVCGQ